MKLVDSTISDVLDITASDAPAPGGGSIAALTGALGAALVGMVASITVGRKMYADHEQLMTDSIDKAEKLRLRLSDIIDRDAEAFKSVSAVFAMPKETDEEKNKRSAAMQTALKSCVMTPIEIMECALCAIELAYEMQGKFNSNAASDLGVAVLSLKAAVKGAWLNVLINLSGIKDTAFVAEYKKRGETILEKALPPADDIYNDVLHSLLL